MEQRPLRLGEIVDDYCPRERRITNHAIVALVGQAIHQTRCATCDAEHAYKQAKAPRRLRKKDGTEALVDEVLAGPGSPAQLISRSESSEAASQPVTAADASAGHTGESAQSADGTSPDAADVVPKIP